MKLGNKISEKRLEPKHAVPSEILEQYPWHWDPMKKDHDDASCYMHTIKDFDSTKSAYQKFIKYTMVNIYHFILKPNNID